MRFILPTGPFLLTLWLILVKLVTSPTGLYKQTTYYPLYLFANLMQGKSLDVHVDTTHSYAGKTIPPFIQGITNHTPDLLKLTKFIDSTAVISVDGKEIRLALLNKDPAAGCEVEISFGPKVQVRSDVTVHEVWSDNLGDKNNFEGEKVKVVTREITFSGVYVVKKHSFQSTLSQVLVS